MRLLGFRFQPAERWSRHAIDPPEALLQSAFVPLGQITAIIGANDVGKSTLLEQLCLALGPESPPIHARLYAEIEQAEMVRLLHTASRSRDDEKELRDPLADALERTRTTGARIGGHTLLSDHPLLSQFLSELSRSSLFALERTGRDEWKVAWCLQPPITLAAPLQEALAQLGRSRMKGLTEVSDDFWVSPWWMDQTPQEPYPFLELGSVSLSQLPAPMKIPAREQDVARAAADAVSEILPLLAWESHLRGLIDANEDALLFGDLQEALSTPAGTRKQSWLERPAPDTVRLHPDVAAARAFLENCVRAVVPEMISHTYRVQVEIAPEMVPSETPVAFLLTPRLSQSSTDEVRPFGLDDAADGLRPWLQLACLDAVAALRDFAHRLRRLAEQLLDLTESLSERIMERLSFDWDVDETLNVIPRDERHAEDLARTTADDAVEVARNDLAAAASPYLDAVQWFRRQCAFDPSAISTTSTGAISDDPRRLFYLLDEPERHLHPRVQRHLAGWLRDLTRVRDFQTIFATHSVSFINQADALTYVHRVGRRSETRSCSADELAALGEIALDLGLDRGQLLADVAVVLFVEGPSDQYVLEGLYRDQLRSAGVAIVPIHGATQLPQVADSQMLLRFTSAKAAILLDNLEASEVARLESDPEHLKAALKSRKTEERALAKLIRETSQQGRKLICLGLPVKDIFFALDSDSIAETFRELRKTHTEPESQSSSPAVEPYPGHIEFWAAFRSSGQKSENWKAFCERRYGIPFKGDVTWFAKVADNMRATARPSAVLADVVERLALAAL